MRYRVQLSNGRAGRIEAACPELPGCRVEGASREEALARIRNAIGYYEEHCPCDLTSEAGVDLEIEDRTAGGTGA